LYLTTGLASGAQVFRLGRILKGLIDFIVQHWYIMRQ
jgi:hypothetical protein